MRYESIRNLNPIIPHPKTKQVQPAEELSRVDRHTGPRWRSDAASATPGWGAGGRGLEAEVRVPIRTKGRDDD